MKKITLLTCMLAISIATFAVVKGAPKQLVSRTDDPSIRVMQEQFNPAAQKLSAADLDTLLVPYLAYNVETYQVGAPSDGLSYSYYQQGWVSEYADTIILVNANAIPCSWYVNDVEVAKDVPYYFYPAEFGEIAMPVMKTPTNDTAAFIDYQVAGLTVADWHNEGYNKFYTAINVAPASLASFTKCAMYTEDKRNSEYGSDWFQVGGGSLGDYSYGSHLKNPWDGGYFDTILVPFFSEAMYIDHITLGVYNKTSAATMFPGDDDHIRLSIYPLTDDGIDWENPIARATANADNYTPYSNDYKYLGLLEFDFLSEDPITGAQSPAPIIVSGNFVVAFDEFNEGTTSVGFLSDYYAESGETYLVGRDSETGEQYITGLWMQKHNILMCMNAFLPAFDAPKTIQFALDELSKQIDIPSNVWDEEMDIESDDWINVEVVTDYSEEEYEGETYYFHNYNNVMTITLEPTSEPRKGTITIEADGLQIKIKVKQGEVEDALDYIRVINDGKYYNILGVEVGDDYKGVVIRNGQKFVR